MNSEILRRILKGLNPSIESSRELNKTIDALREQTNSMSLEERIEMNKKVNERHLEAARRARKRMNGYTDEQRAELKKLSWERFKQAVWKSIGGNLGEGVVKFFKK